MIDYEKEYKTAFEKAKKLKETCDSTAVIGRCEYIFPELKESDDERTRKELIDFIKSHLAGFPQCEKYIAWIEKQGETTIWDKKDEQVLNAAILHIKNKTYNYCGGYTSEYVIQWLESLKNRYIWTPIEKQSGMNIQNNKPFKIESDKFYFCIKDYFAGGCYRSKKGDVVLAKNGMNMMGLSPEQASEYFIPINHFKEHVIVDWFEKEREKSQGKSALEAIKEENVDNANKVESKDYNSIDPHFGKLINKVESKFKIGDWIVYNRTDHSREVMQIYDIRDNRYYFNDNIHFSWSVKECDEKSHLWSIKEAREGDVLATESGKPFIFKGFLDKLHPNSPVAYCGIDASDNFYATVTMNRWTDGKVYPAIIKQCDTLFVRMKEEGYQWDKNKKKLIKL